MRRFDNTGLWEVLASGNPSAALTAKINTVLDDFFDELYAYCREEKNIAERTRSLNYARSELTAFMESPSCGSKKNVPLRRIIKKALEGIGSEMDIVRMDLEHPERFLEFPSENSPLARWGGDIADLIEYFVGPQAAGLLQKPSGKPMTFEETCEWLGKNFGITISNPSDRRGRVLDRQNDTKFQDKMRQVFLEEKKKRSK